MFHCRAALTSGNVIRFVKQFILLYASSSKSEARAELNRAGATVLCALQAADRTERRVTDILRYADWFAFLVARRYKPAKSVCVSGGAGIPG